MSESIGQSSNTSIHRQIIQATAHRRTNQYIKTLPISFINKSMQQIIKESISQSVKEAIHQFISQSLHQWLINRGMSASLQRSTTHPSNKKTN
jgi:hypothetical protein